MVPYCMILDLGNFDDVPNLQGTDRFLALEREGGGSTCGGKRRTRRTRRIRRTRRTRRSRRTRGSRRTKRTRRSRRTRGT